MSFLLRLSLLFAILPWARGQGEMATDIYLGDINVMVLTDVHSWVAGHGRHEPGQNADYGDVLSFYEHLKEICTEDGSDLFFVMNGDFMDGTGLSAHPPSALVNILKKMPWDAINVGNHDIANLETVQYITQPGGFVQWWEDKYLTSNVVKAGTSTPLGARFKMLYGAISESTVLTFGFIYNFMNAANLVKVEQVELVVNSDWFSDVLGGVHGDFDAILVLAHMDINNELIDIILARIREIAGLDMPVQFIAGHTHIRAAEDVDKFSAAFEAGRYLDTIGFVSFPMKDPSLGTDARSEFKHSFINTNTEYMRATLDIDSLETREGKGLSTFIHDIEESMGILTYEGCSPITFVTETKQDARNSLWRLLYEEVIPAELPGWNSTKDIFVAGSGSLRYDLFKGDVLRTDIISVSPFYDKIYKLRDDLPGRVLIQLKNTLTSMVDLWHDGHTELPPYLFSGEIKEAEKYSLYTSQYFVDQVSNVLESVLYAETFNNVGSVQAVLVQGVTTTDMWLRFIKIKWNKCPVGYDGGSEAEGEPGGRENIGALDRGGKIGIGITLAVLLLLTVIYAVVQRASKDHEQPHIPDIYRDGPNLSQSLPDAHQDDDPTTTESKIEII
eukprot:CAMPEP_0198302398 /NCGR_PEP_ID=MMETSP1449-20131203/55002_1 /TAXON_ID=420275 /ORGANISM="Attheya septentrionalis, Strain CCMP2084" /LENGTH=614 /DNA_ID=CAMNT_0044004739 /DNA_START=101 /DNA_END=1945 /DNA_ORIENTATION=+